LYPLCRRVRDEPSIEVQHRAEHTAMSMRALAAAALVMASAWATDDNIVLPPVHTDGPEKMLVFIPGGKVPNQNYVATVKAIQEATTGVKLWAVIPAVFQRLCIISCTSTSLCAPLHSGVEASLSTAKEMGWTRAGKDSDDVWLAGHSLGGVCANTLFQAYTTDTDVPYAGLMVMGSYVDEAGTHDLKHYPKPVLTMNGELDGGLARPGKTAVWWRQHLDLQQAKGEQYALANKPVMVLPQLNHSDFCPGFDVPGDLMAEVDQATATKEISQIVAAFLHGQMGDSSDADVIKEKVAWTRNFLAPYLQAQEMERNASDTRVSAEGSSSICAQGQHIIAGLSEADDSKLTVTDSFHVTSSNLEHCHPNWTVTDGSMSSLSCSHTDYYIDIDNTGEITAASEVACKLLSSDRMAQQLKVKAETPDVDCRAINRHVVALAESMAPPLTLARYKRGGRGWCYKEDDQVLGNIGPLWVFQSSLKMEENATCMAVTSPTLKTEIDGKIFPGSHYCKVLSPARVLDWMMTDSLKPGTKAVVEETQVFV